MYVWSCHFHASDITIDPDMKKKGQPSVAQKALPELYFSCKSPFM